MLRKPKAEAPFARPCANAPYTLTPVAPLPDALHPATTE